MPIYTRTILDPTSEIPEAERNEVLHTVVNPRKLVAAVLNFYAKPLAWAALLVFAMIVLYGGGAAMFYYHAIYLGEGGPAINDWQHWLLDSTVAFVGLTPVLAIILPLSSLVSSWTTPEQRIGLFALLGGVMFAIVTAPGPFLHDAIVGRGTWLADRATEWWGNGQPLTPEPPEVGPIAEVARQLAFGLPLYITLMGVALLVVRALVRLTR